jgi:hypothetical protein
MNRKQNKLAINRANVIAFYHPMFNGCKPE